MRIFLFGRVTLQLYPDSKSKFSRFLFYSIFANAHLYFFGKFRPENRKYFEIQVKNVKYMSKHVFMTHFVVEFEALAVLLPKVSYKFVPKIFYAIFFNCGIFGKVCNFLQRLLYDMEYLSEVVLKEKPWMNQMNMDLETF